MDFLISALNAMTSLIIAITLATVMLNQRIRDGIVIKAGLGSMALGFVVVALHMLKIGSADVLGLQRALLLINSGIAVVIVGYLVRHRGAGHALRRITDWADLDDEPMPPHAVKKGKQPWP